MSNTDKQQIFKATKEQLKSLTDFQQAKNGKSLTQLNKWGGLKALQKQIKLHSYSRGLVIQDSFDLEQRQKKYGKNSLERCKVNPKKSLLQFFTTQYQDLIFQILIGFAFADILLGLWDKGLKTGWIDGLIGIIFISLMMLGYAKILQVKHNQFQKIVKVVSENTSTVLRGGQCYKVPSPELLVGDIVLLENGDIVPADGLLFEAQNIVCDEGYMGEDLKEKQCLELPSNVEEEEETEEAKKEGETIVAEETQKKENNVQDSKKDVFVFSQSRICQGQGKMIILAVGENSYLNEIHQEIYKDFMEVETPIQKKLCNLSHEIGQEGLKAVQVLFVLMLLMLIFQVFWYTGMRFFSVRSLRFFLNQNLITCTLCVIIAIPEGIPLIPYFFKAWHIKNIMQDGVIPYNSACLDNFGQIDSVLVDKTGIVTQQEFQVQNIWILGKTFKFDSERQDFITDSPLQQYADEEEKEEENDEKEEKEDNEQKEEKEEKPQKERKILRNNFEDQIPDPIKKLLLVGLCMNSNADPIFPPKEEQGEQQKSQNKYNAELIKEKVVDDSQSKKSKEFVCKYQQKFQRGNQTDIALLSFAERMGYLYTNYRSQEKDQKQGKPFLTQQNIMWTIYQISNNSYRIFIKGSFDFLSGICSYFLTVKGEVSPITKEYSEQILETIDRYESEQRQRVIMVVCKDISAQKMKQMESVSYEKLEEEILSDLIILCVMGLENQIKPEVKKEVKTLEDNLGVKVRMVTQDSLQLGVSVAKEIGLIDKIKQIKQLQQEYQVMTGDDLMEMVQITNKPPQSKPQQGIAEKYVEEKEPVKKKKEDGEEDDEDEEGEKEEKDNNNNNNNGNINNIPQSKEPKKTAQQQQALNQNREEQQQQQNQYTLLNPNPRTELIAKNLKVLVRATADHKYILQVLLKYYKQCPAFSGDGENDISIFQEIFMGMSCCQSGKVIDKQISDVGLATDSLSNIVKGVQYSRALWTGIKSFCSFYTCLMSVTVFVIGWSELLVFKSVLNPAYLIIVNIILDILSPVFYLTDFKFLRNNQVSNLPEKIDKDLISRYLKQQIGSQIVIQILILGFSQVYLEYSFGTNLLFQFSELENQENLDYLNGMRQSLFTSIYMYMIIFTLIHFRQVQNNSNKGYFANIFLNLGNQCIIVFIILFQVTVTTYGRYFNMNFSALSLYQHISCALAGSFTIIFGFAVNYLFPKQEEGNVKNMSVPYLQLGKKKEDPKDKFSQNHQHHHHLHKEFDFDKQKVL